VVWTISWKIHPHIHVLHPEHSGQSTSFYIHNHQLDIRFPLPKVRGPLAAMGTRAGWDHLQRITSQSMVISHYPTIQWHYMVIKCHHWIVGYNHVKLKTISLEGPFVILRLKTFMSMYQINSHRISNPASVSISILYFSAWKVKVLCPKVATVYPMDLVVHGGTSGVSGVWYGNGPQS